MLLGQTKLPSVLRLAKEFTHGPAPYTRALGGRRRQPRQLVQSELLTIPNAPALRMGDASALDAFGSSVQSSEGTLKTLVGQNGYQLQLGSHVDCLGDGVLQAGANGTHALQDSTAWRSLKQRLCGPW